MNEVIYPNLRAIRIAALNHDPTSQLLVEAIRLLAVGKGTVDVLTELMIQASETYR